MNAYFQQGSSRTRGQIDYRVTRMVPASRNLQAARSAEVAVTADSP